MAFPLFPSSHPILLLLFLILTNPNMANFTGDDSDSDNDADYTPAGTFRRKPRLFTVKLAPQAVVDWYKISLDKSTARRNSAVKEDALGHLLAVGWKIYPMQKKTKQELRYKSPNDRVYISLRTACKAYIDQYNAAAVTITPTVAVSGQSEAPAVAAVPPLKKPNECVKSPVRNLGNKKSPPSAAARGTACDAPIDQAAAAVPTTPISIKAEQCVKSPKTNWGNKKPPPTACNTDIDEADADTAAVPSTASVGEGKETLPFLKKPEECIKSPLVSPMSNWGNKKPPLPTASKSDNEQVSAAALTTTSICEGTQPIPSLKKPKQCVKSPMLNWGNKKPPPSAAARGNRNPRTALFHLIEQGMVSPGYKAYYRIGAAKEDPLTAWGTITNEGLIECDCCSESFSISKFEAHTGSTKHRPAANIFLEDGRSLLDCQKQLTRNQNDDQKVKNDINDKNDSICSICNFGGELILCDLCPAAFHSNCLGFNGIPIGDWFCPSCICKICGQVPYDFDGVCPNHHELDSSFVKCVQCEQSVHVGCVKNIQLLEDNSNDSIDVTNWFCTKSCEDIHIGLQELLWKQIPLQQQQDHNLTWTLMKHTNTMAEHNRKKLDVALGVMRECFQPVKDPITENDIIHDVIYSSRSDIKRLNFEGFYTVVLEMNNIVTTVATVRVYGDEIAEVPFVATRSKHRRRGLCRILMSEIESQLMKLGVKRLTLPAVDEALNTWTNGFGFLKMTDSDKSEFVKYTFLGFQHTVRCQKNLEIKRFNQNDLEWEPRKKVKQTELEDDFFSYMCLDNWNSNSDAL